MAERRAFIILATGTDENEPVRCCAWEVPQDEQALDQLARTLTAQYGEPREWVSGRDSSGSQRVVFSPDLRGPCVKLAVPDRETA